MSDPKVSLIEIVLHGVFAVGAGLLGHLMRLVEGGTRFRLLNAVVEALSAGFVGILVLLACKASGVDTLWTGVIVGVLSWMGASASIRVLESAVYRRLGLTKPRRAEDARDAAADA